MKKAILIAMLMVGSSAFAAQHRPVITVQSQGITMQLNQADVAYLQSRPNGGKYFAGIQNSRLIKNNSTADLIIATLKARR